jgi:hypothetical protein
MRSLRLVPVFALAALSLAPTAARAQPGAYPGAPRLRTGLELGIGLQVGEISCESEGDFCNDFTEAGGLNLNAAYFLSPKLAVALDLWAMSHREDDFTFTHFVNTIGLKLRPTPRLTLSAGLGSAHARLDYDGVIAASATSEDAFAIMGAASLDVIRGPRWALSVEARFGAGFYGDDNDNDTADVVGRNAGLGAAFTFFGF